MSDSTHTNPPEPGKQPEPRQQIDAYLDGLLAPAVQQTFERELATNDSPRRECELQQQVDASLVRSFSPPPPPADILAFCSGEPTADDELGSDERNRLAATEPAEPARRRWTSFAVIAAAIAWIVVGVSMYRNSTDDGYQQLALADIYAQCVDDGFQPKWVCDDDREFAATFQRRQGIPLLLKDEAQDKMVGLSYLKGISNQTTTMLARVEGQPILVFVDKKSRDTNPAKPPWLSGLSLFRKELADLVLYEITPLSEPHLIEQFYQPDSINSLPSGANAAAAEQSTSGGE